jgi:uncharacterized membrane protein YgdD (TMEM256/DUF423 family)
MEDKRLERALSWAGSGGTALALATLMIAAMYATTPDGQSPVAEIAPCFSAGCTTASTAAHPAVKAAPAKPVHKGRITSPSTTTAKPAPVHVTAAPSWSTALPSRKLSAPVVAMAAANNALVMVGSDGGVFPIGEAGFFGSLAGKDLAGRIAGVAVAPISGGYWLAGDDGGVFSLNAPYFGSLGKVKLAAPVVGIAATPTGSGYWLASADGGVFGFGDARFLGSLSRVHLAKPVVAIMSTPSGEGYWLVSADGGVFPFGDATFKGSLGGRHLAKPVVAATPTVTGLGYWLVSADGGVFSFGDATYHGNAIAKHPSTAVSAIVPSATDGGYWLADQSGAVYAFGDAQEVVVAGTKPKPRPLGRPAAHPAPPAKVQHAPVTAQPHAHIHTDFTEYRRGQSGYDVSMYQCSNMPPQAAVSVVQVTGGGLDQPPNPCYVQEAQWAGPNMSAYIYMDGLPSSPPAAAWNGPAGNCDTADIGCQSYNYGYNEAVLYVRSSRMRGVDPKLWWLDVERYSNWTSVASNELVIQGALDGLKAVHTVSGVYSTKAQWDEITGGMSIRGEMEWVPGAGNMTGPGYSAVNMCNSPRHYTFGGGVLEIVQFGYQGPFPGSYAGPTTYDQDYACW